MKRINKAIKLLKDKWIIKQMECKILTNDQKQRLIKALDKPYNCGANLYSLIIKLQHRFLKSFTKSELIKIINSL